MNKKKLVEKIIEWVKRNRCEKNTRSWEFNRGYLVIGFVQYACITGDCIDFYLEKVLHKGKTIKTLKKNTVFSFCGFGVLQKGHLIAFTDNCGPDGVDVFDKNGEILYSINHHIFIDSSGDSDRETCAYLRDRRA